ncbi:hypothetical protein INT46_010591 [Mucor plumbeus]|uniref:Uncharacterized protein n=1 Tax=Mucor plumbeus TaxID=97098 RepID=A0A8H7QIF9_9FUNG|nr:hypothetical protein INT46_010591 [Mucor plumbeus]
MRIISDDNTFGVVDVPFPCSEIKLVGVAEMEYHATDKPYPRGEICIHGNLFIYEFYKLSENTAKAIGQDGRLHTGDVGLFTLGHQ